MTLQVDLPLFKGVDFGECCCRCGAVESVIRSSGMGYDGDRDYLSYLPLWRCQVCQKRVCRDCTLINPKTKTYYGMTMCSEVCRLVHLTEWSLLGNTTDPEDEDDSWSP